MRRTATFVHTVSLSWRANTRGSVAMPSRQEYSRLPTIFPPARRRRMTTSPIERCSRSISTSFGNTADIDSSPALPANSPPTRGSMTRSANSRPKRRAQNAATDSSASPLRRGIAISAMIRRRAGSER